MPAAMGRALIAVRRNATDADRSGGGATVSNGHYGYYSPSVCLARPGRGAAGRSGFSAAAVCVR